MQNIEFKTGVIKPIECMKEGWELIKNEYWMFFAITLVGMLIGSIAPFGILIGAMFCGIYYCMFQKMEGYPVTFEGLFKGFSYFLPGFVTALIVIIPSIVLGIFMYISVFGVVFGLMDSRGQLDDSAIFVLFGTMMVEGVIMGLILSCLHAFIMFSFPLIVDKNLDGWSAFKLSAKAGWANLSGVIGLILAEFALGFVGYLLCGIGLYLTLPIMFAGVLVAYRRVFPSIKTNFANVPPPPSAYF